MHNKTCIVCGEPFASKRSDANFCSPKCRAKFGYHTRQVKDRMKSEGESFTSQPITNQNILTSSAEEVKVSLKGELSVEYVINVIKEAEESIQELDQRIADIRIENQNLAKSNLELSEKKCQMERAKLSELEHRLSLHDVDIYNNFLNNPLSVAFNKKHISSNNKRLTKLEYESYKNRDLQLTVLNYKKKISDIQIPRLKGEIEKLEVQINFNTALQENNLALTKDLQKEVIFNRTRIIRHERLLNG